MNISRWMLFNLFFFVLFIVLPILIGIYVYCDAKRRGMHAIPWTLLAALIPAFIGLIIYLIVRSDHSPLVCNNCGKPVKEPFVHCPYCGALLKELCKTCGHPLEAGWKLCPECGTAIDPEQETVIRTKQPTDRGIVWLLVVVILVPVLFCVLIIRGLVYDNVSTGSSTIYTTSMSVEDIFSSNIDAEAWIADCDAAGEGVYVLRAAGTENTSEIRTAYLVYRNDGYRFLEIYLNNGTLFSKPEIELDYEKNIEDEDYDLLYCVASGDKAYNLTIRSRSADSDNSKFVSTDFDMEELDSLWVNSSGLTVDVSIADNADCVNSVSCTFYADDDAIQTDTSESADHTSLAGTSLSFYSSSSVHDEITAFEMSFYDKNENLLFLSSFDLEDEDIGEMDHSYSFIVSTGEDGNLILTDSNGNIIPLLSLESWDGITMSLKLEGQ